MTTFKRSERSLNGPELDREAQLDRITAELVESDAKFRVLAETGFEILKAVNTGNFSEFSGVTNKASYRAYLKEKLRAALSGRSDT